jgi:ribosomal protein S18 acetylase RimI-like enzyme
MPVVLDRAIHFNHREVPNAPTPPRLPDGFRYRTVEPEDLAERVAIHRDVREPSRVTESSYRNVMAEWPYRSSLDCVVEAPEGRFASYVLVWPDDDNGVGLFEPVGTRAEFRRRGLGTAVCTFGLQRLHEEGLRRAVVGCDSETACALCESIGFRRSWTIKLVRTMTADHAESLARRLRARRATATRCRCMPRSSSPRTAEGPK